MTAGHRADPVVTDRMIRVGPHRLHVSITGTGTPVLLLNGLGGNIALWRALQQDLGGLRIIAFDAPGVGSSSTPALPYSISMLADIVAGLLDALDLDRVDVVGYSFGGVLAQQFARSHPLRVRRLVLVSTAPGWGAIVGDVPSLLSIITPVRYYSERAYALTAPFLAGGAGEKDEEFIQRTVAARTQDPPSVIGYYLQLLAAWSWSSLPWLARIPHPTVVLTGSGDRLIPAANSALIASQLRNARLVGIDGWGHYAVLDSSSGAGGKIREFLAAASPRDSSTWRSGVAVGRSQADAAIAAHRSLLSTMLWPQAVYRNVVLPQRRGPASAGGVDART